ncbi:XRE family transcriptional regulator [Anaerotruncus sp. AF02-27]|jgi:transcriptional regulator with XRE-family HTH domain|nr:XRE family transcriptional regulator [Anaerotruncus sp. AF02-27]
MLSMTIGVNVKKYREQKGLSQEKLAYKSNLSVATISKIERGLTNPTADVIESIARALDVPVLWLVA